MSMFSRDRKNKKFRSRNGDNNMKTTDLIWRIDGTTFVDCQFKNLLSKCVDNDKHAFSTW